MQGARAHSAAQPPAPGAQPPGAADHTRRCPTWEPARRQLLCAGRARVHGACSVTLPVPRAPSTRGAKLAAPLRQGLCRQAASCPHFCFLTSRRSACRAPVWRAVARAVNPTQSLRQHAASACADAQGRRRRDGRHRSQPLSESPVVPVAAAVPGGAGGRHAEPPAGHAGQEGARNVRLAR